MAILTSTRIDFLKYRYYCFAFSALIFAAFFGGIAYKYQTRGSAFLYSVEFTGGTQVLFGFSQPVSGESVARILSSNNFADANIREFSDRELLVRVKGFENDTKGLAERLRTILETSMSGVKVEIKQTDSVGVGVGSDLRKNSVWAVLLCLLIMLLYIWFRFRSFSFAFGNLVSLLHDAIVILTLVIWLDYEISMNIITAVLFVLGYSIHDTIVIFSRIRERMHKKTGETPTQLVNTSINETLRRSILTSFATALVVASLFIFGGEVLRTLSFALLVGIVFGTYSSIYIASPVMLLLYREKK